ncbi:MAG: 3-deoxy-manno-octulosonate cytidylyltransferase [Gammaproteobacteria bacterium]|nr:3-deoxy-manno-octulosonate cytidylyltransferase [Gammaproteobacteria bacterium]
MNKSVLGVIPARYKSSRFEGKPLVEINGIPMLKRTYEQARKSDLLSELIVATEDARIVEYCESEKIPVVMTSAECLTGTDRLAEVADQYAFDFYINIQGDEPVIDPETISQLISEYEKYGEEYIAYNLYKVIFDQEEINSKTIVKVVVNQLDELMYMSRLAIPFSKSGLEPSIKQQIPVYGFTREALKVFASHTSKTCNEKYEDIELLRFVDLGYKLKMSETYADSISVDVPSDVQKVERFLNKQTSNLT